MGGLSDKQQAFVDEYLIDLNGAQAAIRAGYSAKTAKEQASRLLTNVHVAEAVRQAKNARSARTGITADRVLDELGKIGFSDIRKLFTEAGDLKAIHALDDDTAGALSSIEVVTKRVPGGDEAEVEHVAKVRLWDKRAALVDLGKATGLFKDGNEIGVNVSFAVERTERSHG